jgi:hypothetical protein
VLLALARVLAYDNWRSGMGWAQGRPASGYLPFYLCVILAGASLYGLGVVAERSAGRQDVRHARPAAPRHAGVRADALFALRRNGSALRRELAADRRLHALIGRIAWWKSLVTSAVFACVMFVDLRRRVRRDHAQGPARSALRL